MWYMTKNYFSTFKGTNDLKKNSKNNQLGSYLAGLIEGDGYILVRQGIQEKVSPAIILTFHEK